MAAAYAGLVPLLEVVSGVLADRWSRRGVLVIGNLGAFASVLLGGLSNSVGMYIVAAMFLGVYFAMQSGTFDADRLRHRPRGDRVERPFRVRCRPGPHRRERCR